MKTSDKTGFTPIELEDYIQRHLKNNSDTSREEIESGLRSALADHKAGVKCDCGNPIWVIGSASWETPASHASPGKPCRLTISKLRRRTTRERLAILSETEM